MISSYRTGMPVASLIAAAASAGVGWSPASSRVRPANRVGLGERERGELGDVFKRDDLHGFIRREEVPVHAAR